jgi:hypothetical protein
MGRENLSINFFARYRNISLHYQQGEREVKTVIREIKFRGKCEYYVPAWKGNGRVDILTKGRSANE